METLSEIPKFVTIIVTKVRLQVNGSGGLTWQARAETDEKHALKRYTNERVTPRGGGRRRSGGGAPYACGDTGGTVCGGKGGTGKTP